MLLAIPVVWEEKDHITDCYFCMINLKKKNKSQEQAPCPYPDNPSAIRSIPHGHDLPLPELDGNMECSSDSEHSDMTVVVGYDVYKPKENN